MVPSGLGSVIDLNGVPNRSITLNRKPHKLLILSFLQKNKNPEKIVNLYADGHSINEISKALRKSRKVIKRHLVKEGILSESDEKENEPLEKILHGKVRWNSPYGFRFEKGRPQKHPQEFEVLLIILHQGDEGQNAREIADYLNAERFRPRIAERWDRFTIYQIIQWHKRHPNFLKEVLEWDSNNLSKSLLF